MSLQDAQPEEPFVILIITPEEARCGGIHMLMKPDGHAVMVTIPENTHENDEIRLPSQGSAGSDGTAPADLVVRVVFNSPNTSTAPAHSADPITSPESTLLFANPQPTDFPLILTETTQSAEQPALLGDTPTINPGTFPPQTSQSKFPIAPVTPNPQSAPAAIPANHEASPAVSELPTTPVPAVSTPLAEAPVAPIDGETLILESVAPATPLPGMALPISGAGIASIPASSEIVLPDASQDGDPLNPSISLDDAADNALSDPPILPDLQAANAPSQLVLLTPAPRRSKRLDTLAIVSLCAAVLLLLLSIGVAIFSFGYYQPAQAAARATATANAIPTATLYGFQTQSAQEGKTSIAQNLATVTSWHTLYTQSTSTRPFINDSLTHQSSTNWDEGQASDNTSCAFAHGSYEVTIPLKGFFTPCFAGSGSFTNFAIQVNMKIRQGGGGGILFRDGYLFGVDNDGYYYLNSYTTNHGKTLAEGQATSYNVGQSNQLTVIATGTILYVYVNQNFITSVTDHSFGEGGVALIADDYQDTTVVDYNNFKLWLLP